MSYEQVYAMGLEAESAIKRYWLSRGREVVEANEEANIHLDIDFYTSIGNLWVAVSVKSMAAAAYTGNFSFELTTERGYPTGVVKNSWYYTGKADYYLIIVDPLSYSCYGRPRLENYRPWYVMLEKSVITEYVDTHGWDSIRGLNRKVLGLQHGLDTRVGLLRCAKIVGSNVRYLPRGWNE